MSYHTYGNTPFSVSTRACLLLLRPASPVPRHEDFGDQENVDNLADILDGGVASESPGAEQEQEGAGQRHQEGDVGDELDAAADGTPLEGKGSLELQTLLLAG